MICYGIHRCGDAVVSQCTDKRTQFYMIIKQFKPAPNRTALLQRRKIIGLMTAVRETLRALEAEMPITARTLCAS